MPAIQPVLADIGGLIAVGFLIISFIGWLSNLISGQKPPAPQRRRPLPNRDRRIQDEIDAFLKEAVQGRKPRRKRRPPSGRAEILSADEIEIVEEPRTHRPAPPSAKPQHKPVGTLKPKVKPHDLAQNVQSHFKSHMSERIDQIVESHLSHEVDKSVTEHLGVFTGEKTTARIRARETTRIRKGPAAALVEAMRSKQGVRQAILFNEILSPPLARRQ